MSSRGTFDLPQLDSYFRRATAVMSRAGAGILLASACAPADFDWRQMQTSVLNGADGRTEPFELGEPQRSVLLGSSAALLHAHHIVEMAPDTLALKAVTLGDKLGLCPEERFADQPAAAFCSGVLVDDDLVVTARHCLADDPVDDDLEEHCRDLRVAFGYALTAPAGPVMLGSDDVFACRRAFTAGAFAAIQLDRPVVDSVAPRAIATAAAAVGDQLLVASHGAGLPLKIELASEVVHVDASVLTLAMDTFGGSSGAGLYDSSLRLMGVVADGAPDWEGDNGCVRAAQSADPSERALRVDALTELICGSGWPSPRLCDSAPKCGDRVCSVGESARCREDCPPPRCGDELCEPAERGSCLVDCARYADVPATWSGSPAGYVAPVTDDGKSEATLRAAGGCSLARPHAPWQGAWLFGLLLTSSRLRCRSRRRAGFD